VSLLDRLRETLASIPALGPRAAQDKLNAGALLLDVREPHEWAAGHPPQAQHLPLGRLPANLDRLPHDREIVVICRSGNRSRHAAGALARSGRRAYNLDGGIRAWAAAGLPIVGPGGRPGRIV